MLERLTVFKKNIIIATTNDGTEQPIVDLCKQLGVRYFQGDTNNVLQRYYLSAQSVDAKNDDTIVRLTSDCPLIDPVIIQAAINYYCNHSFDYISAGVASGFPRGMDTEIFSFRVLAQAYQNAQHDYEKEHVTPYIYKTCPEQYSIGQYKNTQDHSKYRLTLDEENDYQAIKEVYKYLGCRTDFVYSELIQVLQNNPYIFELNASVEQKKVS
jgi:spore coat polysaccharide biosynthesis protein SpsF